MSEEQVRLVIKLDNVNRIDLHGATKSLHALACEYDLYCSKEWNDIDKNDRKLEIVKLEEGSVHIELIPFVLPFFDEANSAIYFAEYFGVVLDYFIGKSKQLLPEWFGKRSCNNFSNIIELTAVDHGAKIGLAINSTVNNIVTNNYYSSDQCKVAKGNMMKYEDKLLEKESSQEPKQAFYWETVSFVEGVLGNKDSGIIESIDKKARKIIFMSEADKSYMITSRSDKEWQNLLYFVDVEIIRVQDKIKVYKILKVYEEDTTEID